MGDMWAEFYKFAERSARRTGIIWHSGRNESGSAMTRERASAYYHKMIIFYIEYE